MRRGVRRRGERAIRAANVSLVGSNQQAIGARFVWTGPSISHLSASGDAGNIHA